MRHSSQSAKCAAASREIISPSNNADASSAASSQFIVLLSFVLAFHAIHGAVLLAPYRAATLPSRAESPESPQVPRSFVLPLRATTIMIATLPAIAPTHLQCPPQSQLLLKLADTAGSLYDPLVLADATIPRRVCAQSRKHIPAAF